MQRMMPTQPKLKKELTRFFELVSAYRKIVGRIWYVLCMAFGYFLLAPFLVSPTFKYANDLSEQSSFFEELFGFGDLLIEPFLTVLLPYTVFWSISFFLFEYFAEKIEKLNRTLEIAALFFSGPKKFLYSCFFAFFGVCLFAAADKKWLSSLALFSVSSILFGMSGYFFHRAKVKFNEKMEGEWKEWLVENSYYIAITLALVALLIWGWLMFSPLFEKYQLVNELVKEIPLLDCQSEKPQF